MLNAANALAVVTWVPSRGIAGKNVSDVTAPWGLQGRK